MEKYDVVIIGGGPAGSTLAHFLKDKGFESIIIEKGDEFRDKVCAGGLPTNILKVLPQELSDFKKVEYNKMAVYYKNKLYSEVSFERPFAYGVMRREFDHCLRNGINVHYNERFIKYEENKNNVIIYTDKEKYEGRFLVGADGVGSIVSTLSGIGKRQRFIIGEEKEVQDNSKDKSTMSIFLGYNYLGYGWSLPKETTRSSGSGAMKGHFKQATVNQFDKDTAPIKFFPISLWRGREALTKGRISLTGEAASIVDPFTAAGIYTSIISSIILSEVIEKSLKSGRTTIEGYEDALKERLFEEFQYALELSKMFYPFLPLIKQIIVKESTLKLVGELVLEGYISYKEMFRRVEHTKRTPVKIAYYLVKIFTRNAVNYYL